MPQTVEDDARELRVCMNVLMGQIGIDYSKLTKEEQMTLLRVFNKSSMLKHRTKAGMRGKHRRCSYSASALIRLPMALTSGTTSAFHMVK